MSVIADHRLLLDHLEYQGDGDVTSILKLFMVISLATEALSIRSSKFTRSRINWARHAHALEQEGRFYSFYRMTLHSYEKLAVYLYSAVDVNETMSTRSTGKLPITPEIVLHCCLRYLAGAAYEDVQVIAQISVPSFFRILWIGMRAICLLERLKIKLPTTPEELNDLKGRFATKSSHHIMQGCVAALDGWLLCIKTPSSRDVADVPAFFSGHYQCMGINCQAMCDEEGRFLFIGLLCPGKSSDVVAYGNSTLKRWVEELPPYLFVAADNAYINTEHMLTLFSGSQKNNHDISVFNFFLSQLRITIEMAFGKLVNKFRIFMSPLQANIKKTSLIVQTAAILHNFCIDERTGVHREDDFVPFYRGLQRRDPNNRVLGYVPSDISTNRVRPPGTYSETLREAMKLKIKNKGIRRPSHNIERRRTM